MPRHDVAIYSPYAELYYDASAKRVGGGAERQTALLARALASRGARVAHIVYPVAEPTIDPDAPVTLVERSREEGLGRTRALAGETVEVWRALSRADATVQVFRGASGAMGVAGLWARRYRRRLVFAGANNADFTLETIRGRLNPVGALYRAGLTAAESVVVQSSDQARLARERFPALRRIDEIPSFVEPALEAQGEGEAFLWVSRLAEYKRPLLYPILLRRCLKRITG